MTAQVPLWVFERNMTKKKKNNPNWEVKEAEEGFTWSKLQDRFGPSLTARYHQTSTFVRSKASVLTWMDVRGCMRSFMRLPLQRMSKRRGDIQPQKVRQRGSFHGGLFTQGRWTTWIKGKVVYEALPGNEGDFLDGGRWTAESQFLQVQEGIYKRTAFVQQLLG